MAHEVNQAQGTNTSAGVTPAASSQYCRDLVAEKFRLIVSMEHGQMGWIILGDPSHQPTRGGAGIAMAH